MNIYDESLQDWKETQREQITKGLKKYNKPLTPKDLSFTELYNHAMEESVDLTHYLTAIKRKVKDLEVDNALLRAELAIKTYQLERLMYGPNYRATEPVDEPKKPSYMDLDD